MEPPLKNPPQPATPGPKLRKSASRQKFPLVEVLLVFGILVVLEFNKAPQKPPATLVRKTPVQVSEKPVNLPLPKVDQVAEVSPIAHSTPASVEGATVPTEAVHAPDNVTNPPGNPAKLFGDESVLVLTGLDARREPAIQRQKDLLNRAIDEKAWNAYRQFLQESIAAGIQGLAKGQGVNRFDAVWKEPALEQAILRWKLLGCFSNTEITARVEDRYTGEMLLWLLDNNRAMEEVLLTLKPEDDAGKVLGFLMEAWPISTGKMEKYFSLVLACAVVFDRQIEIQHPVGGSSAEASQVEPMKRYLWYIGKNEKGQLAAPVHHSTARDLVWAICAPVAESELEWSLDKMHISRKNWGSAYGMIEYLMERAVKGLNPYKEYSFAEILKEGGICGDQSYFCVNTARAQGIPAMIFSGETDLGPHAWAGLKFESDEWTTGVGRVGGVSKGQTIHPQTGKAITEQEVQLWSDRAHQSPVITLAVARHLWLASFFEEGKDETNENEAIRLANQLGPSFTETWALVYESLKKQMKITGTPAVPSNLEEWKNFAKALRQEFKDNPRMAGLAAKAESEYIFPYGEDGDAARTLLRERRRIERNSGEQTDLIAESLKREADLILKRGESTALREISALYDSALRKYGGSVTGFKMMAEDYFGFLKGDPELGPKAARDIELAFKRVVETGTKDWFRAKTESSIYKMICGYYRAAGDEERATMLEKRYEVLLKRAERSAL
jgi:hypothetical protein